MPKMHHFSNKFLKIYKRWGLAYHPQHPLIFNIGDLKLRDLTKLWFFKLIVSKSNFKKSVITSFLWHHRHFVSQMTSLK